MSVDGYLARLGVIARPQPTVDTLTLLHRAHLATLPYDNLAIMLGRPASVDPHETLARIATGSDVGYCFHHNGAFEVVLRELGYDVERRWGLVWSDEAHRSDPSLTHLGLIVHGLPSAAHPGGDWLVDLGLGDTFRDPLPLVEGAVSDDGFAYRLSRSGDTWTFHHDPRGSFTGVDLRAVAPTPDDVAAAHRALSTPPDGRFTRTPVIQLRTAGAAVTLRGCTLTRVGEHPATRELATYDAWRDAVRSLGVVLDGVADEELRVLYADAWQAHPAWRASAG